MSFHLALSRVLLLILWERKCEKPAVWMGSGSRGSHCVESAFVTCSEASVVFHGDMISADGPDICDLLWKLGLMVKLAHIECCVVYLHTLQSFKMCRSISILQLLVNILISSFALSSPWQELGQRTLSMWCSNSTRFSSQTTAIHLALARRTAGIGDSCQAFWRFHWWRRWRSA